MDKEGKELSRLGLQTISGEMSPEYLKIRERLLGYLAASGATVEQLAEKDNNERANIEMLSSFTKMLPKATLENARWQFISDDPYQIRAIQSNIIWRKENSGMTEAVYGVRSAEAITSYRPYFIFGRSGQEKSPRLLLACVGENDIRRTEAAPLVAERYGRLFYYEPDKKNTKRLSALQAIEASDYPGPDVMKQLFDIDAHQLVVTAKSPGSTIMTDYDPVSRHPLTHMTDETLGVMDVNSYMHKIATKLGIEARLDHVLAQAYTPIKGTD